MTLIIGMDCLDCLLLCADREESTELGGKRSVSKIHQAQGQNWGLLIATAGSGPISDLAAERIIAEARAAPAFNANPRETFEKVMIEVYEKYIFPRDEHRQRERGISLILGVIDEESRQRFLFKTFDEIVKTESHYACAGVGSDVAYYFLDRLHADGFSGSEAMKLLAFILREAKSSVSFVGKESEFVQIVHKGEYSGFMGRSLVGEAIDWREIPQLSQCLISFWKTKPSTSETSERV
jgi:20S proteasome alpha/beta subunit